MEPAEPNKQYDFILSDPKQAKKRFSLPSLSTAHFSHISVISLIVVVVILFAILLFGGGSSANQPMLDSIARAQEIKRVSILISTQGSATQDTKDLAATVQSSLLSQQAQLVGYLKTTGNNIDTTKQTAYLNSGTDQDLQKAAQNDSLANYYSSYLKTSLAAYETSLQTAYKTAPAKARPAITDAFNSTKVIASQL